MYLRGTLMSVVSDWHYKRELFRDFFSPVVHVIRTKKSQNTSNVFVFNVYICNYQK